MVAIALLIVMTVAGGDSDRSPAPVPASTVPEVPAPNAPDSPNEPVTLVVGRDIPAGRLTADPLGESCRWERVHTDDDGVLDELRGSGAGPHTIVDVDPTDTALVATGCGPWRPYVPPATPATTINDGDWLVGSDVAPGRYVALAPPEGEFCYWGRGRGFTGADDDTIATPDPELRVRVVDLVAGERFTTGDCGPWVPR